MFDRRVEHLGVHGRGAGLSALVSDLSNWGRWGDADERGTLNFISPQKVLDATRGVSAGRVVSIAHDLDIHGSAKNRRPTQFMMLYHGDDASVSTDYLGIFAHSLTVTHIDAISHVSLYGMVYNGRAVRDVVRTDGLDAGSVHAFRDGIVTRGVFLDVATSLGRDYLGPEYEVTEADLDLAERHAGLRVEPGDAIFVRVGLAVREGVEGPEDGSVRAGLSVECLRWLSARQVSVYGGDCFDKIPSFAPGVTHPMHAVGMVAMGLVMLDNVAMEPLKSACEAENRYDFLVVVAPLRVPRGTGSAVNPLCIF